MPKETSAIVIRFISKIIVNSIWIIQESREVWRRICWMLLRLYTISIVWLCFHGSLCVCVCLVLDRRKFSGVILRRINPNMINVCIWIELNYDNTPVRLIINVFYNLKASSFVQNQILFLRMCCVLMRRMSIEIDVMRTNTWPRIRFIKAKLNKIMEFMDDGNGNNYIAASWISKILFIVFRCEYTPEL